MLRWHGVLRCPGVHRGRRGGAGGASQDPGGAGVGEGVVAAVGGGG